MAGPSASRKLARRYGRSRRRPRAHRGAASSRPRPAYPRVKLASAHSRHRARPLAEIAGERFIKEIVPRLPAPKMAKATWYRGSARIMTASPAARQLLPRLA